MVPHVDQRTRQWAARVCEGTAASQTDVLTEPGTHPVQLSVRNSLVGHMLNRPGFGEPGVLWGGAYSLSGIAE